MKEIRFCFYRYEGMNFVHVPEDPINYYVGFMYYFSKNQRDKKGEKFYFFKELKLNKHTHYVLINHNIAKYFLTL